MKGAKIYSLDSDVARNTLAYLDHLKEGDIVKSDLFPALPEQVVWTLKSRVDKFPLESWLLESTFCDIPFNLLWVKLNEQELSFAFQEME